MGSGLCTAIAPGQLRYFGQPDNSAQAPQGHEDSRKKGGPARSVRETPVSSRLLRAAKARSLSFLRLTVVALLISSGVRFPIQTLVQI